MERQFIQIQFDNIFNKIVENNIIDLIVMRYFDVSKSSEPVYNYLDWFSMDEYKIYTINNLIHRIDGPAIQDNKTKMDAYYILNKRIVSFYYDQKKIFIYPELFLLPEEYKFYARKFLENVDQKIDNDFLIFFCSSPNTSLSYKDIKKQYPYGLFDF